jgi:hypothetical protein
MKSRRHSHNDLKPGKVYHPWDPDAVVLIDKMPDKEEAVEGEVAEGEHELNVIAKGRNLRKAKSERSPVSSQTAAAKRIALFR